MPMLSDAEVIEAVKQRPKGEIAELSAGTCRFETQETNALVVVRAVMEGACRSNAYTLFKPDVIVVPGGQVGFESPRLCGDGIWIVRVLSSEAGHSP